MPDSLQAERKLPNNASHSPKLFDTTMQRGVALSVLMALIVLWSVLALEVRNSEQQTMDEVARETTAWATIFANETQNTFQKIDYALQDMRRTWLEEPGEMGGRVKVQKEFLTDVVTQIAVVGADGYLAYSDRGMPRSATFMGDLEYIAVHRNRLEDRLFVSRPIKDKDTGQWSIQVSRPLYRRGTFAGVIVVAVEPDSFVRFFQHSGMGQDGAARMIRDTGEIMARSSGQENYLGKVIRTSPYGDPGAPQQGTFRRAAQADGVERLSSYYRLSQYGLTVVVGPSLERRMAPVRLRQLQISAATLAMSLLVLIVAWQLLRAMGRRESAHRELALAESTLRAAEQKYRLLTENATDIVWHMGPDFRLDFVSPACEWLLGYAPEEFLGSTLDRFLRPDWRKLARAQIDDESLSGISGNSPTHVIRYELEHRCRDGSWKWMEVNYSIRTDGNGKILGYQGSTRDISQRKAAELSLANETRMLQVILNNAPLGIWMTSTTGKIQFVNKTFCQATGITEQQFARARHYADVLPKKVAPNCMRSDEECLAQEGGVHLSQETLPFVDGKDHLLEITKVRVVSPEGKVLGLIGLAVDITEREHARQAIVEFTRNFESFLSQTTDFIYFKDHESRFRFCSQTLANVTGHRHWRDLIGKHDVEVFPPDLARLYMEEEIAVLAQGKALLNKVNPYFTADGTPGVIETNKWPLLDQGGQIVGLFGISRDITERSNVQRQAQLRQTVLQLLADQRGLNVILESIVLSMEAMQTDTLCSVLLLDDTGRFLQMGAAPSLPDAFNKSVDGLAIGPQVGSCGTAAYTGKLVVVPDIQTDPLWDSCRDMAMQTGLAACWAQPIISGQGKVLGTFATYKTKVCSPTPADLAFMEEAAVLAALAIRNSADQDHLRLAASVFTHAREGILITDSHGNIAEVNDAYTWITGYSREESIGQNPRILQSGRHTKAEYKGIWDSLASQGHWSGEVWNRNKDGTDYALMQTISAVRDNSGAVQHYVAMFTDITDIKEQQQRLEHIAHYDALTNLPNRVLLADRLRQAMSHCLRRGQTLAVAYLDLDGFKEVNDSHGHGVGDRMLIAVSQHIKEALREGDTLARIGGDEFVAVMVDLDDTTHCEPVLLRLLRAAARPVTVDDKVLQVAASIGVTLYPKDNADPDLLLRHADQAMYFAKDAGKNQYHFYDVESAANVQSERESLQAIGLALERHEFVLHYQPKVNMRTGEVVGVEALIRWQHPQRGLLSPAAFLSTVENHTLAISIGEWVIATALEQMASWQKMGLELPVSVNIGASQLEQQGFPKRLAQLLASQPGIPAHCLQLEVLESSAMDDTTLVSVSMQACMALGVTFALDDFGTGYSSLAYLRRLPAETLKIDQSFVRDMLSDPNDLAIVQGVISLAQAFRRSVIAEGVETRLHGDKLLELGCELAQGYGIARPMPADQIPAWAKRWQSQPNWTA